MFKGRSRIISLVIAGVFGLVTIIAAVVVFFTVRYVVLTMETFKLPGVVIKDEVPLQKTPKAGETAPAGQISAAPVPAAPSLPPWDGASRVNILLLGLDARDWAANEGPPRSDTMMILSIDPVAKAAAMLSIPRDLWVNIPDYDYGRINTAYQLGEAYKVPGGGPGQASRTVEALLGIPIQYYAQVDFQTFVDFIDGIGGIKIDVAKSMKIDMLGNEPLINKKKGQTDLGDKSAKVLKPGHYTFDGPMALAYARVRKEAGDDFERATRQQQVIFAIRDRLLQFDRLGILITEMPKLYSQISSGIHTNMTFDEAFRLGWMAKDIPINEIAKGVIGKDQITFAKSPDGTQDVLKPRPQEIRALRDQVFASNQTMSPIAAAGIEYAVQAEHSKITVLNGTPGSGQAQAAGPYLQKLGLNIIQTGDAGEASSVTTIVDYTGNPYTIRYLQKWFSLNPRYVKSSIDLNSAADLAIVIGNDWHQP